jgi:hypothetical protein
MARFDEEAEVRGSPLCWRTAADFEAQQRVYLQSLEHSINEESVALGFSLYSAAAVRRTNLQLSGAQVLVDLLASGGVKYMHVSQQVQRSSDDDHGGLVRAQPGKCRKTVEDTWIT